MNNGKGKWPENVTVKGDPLNDSNRRYMLKIFPKDSAQIKKEILVIMLNPSKADEDSSDKTCKVLINLCDWNGYNGITICNLFSLRKSNVKELNEEIQDANDSLNDLKRYIEPFDEVLCAWGRAEGLKDRNLYNERITEVYEILANKKLKEFGHSSLNGNIYPYHPLYYIYTKSKEPCEINEHKPWT